MGRDDPSRLEDAANAFRVRHPARIATIDGVAWSYRLGGSGGPSILLLTGALGQADFSFPVIEALGRQARVLAPDYPPVRDFDRLTPGLIQLLDREGAGAVHVVGGSFGGVVAQAFAWRHPERVASLVLSHCGAARRVRGRQIAAGLLRLLPAPLLRSLMANRLRPALRDADPFWASAFERSLAALEKRDILARVALAADFGRRFASRDPGPARFPVLILDSDDDPLFCEADRAALLASYPGAEHRRFQGTGHISSLLEPDEFAAAIADFVRRAEGAQR